MSKVLDNLWKSINTVVWLADHYPSDCTTEGTALHLIVKATFNVRLMQRYIAIDLYNIYIKVSIVLCPLMYC